VFFTKLAPAFIPNKSSALPEDDDPWYTFYKISRVMYVPDMFRLIIVNKIWLPQISQTEATLANKATDHKYHSRILFLEAFLHPSKKNLGIKYPRVQSSNQHPPAHHPSILCHKQSQAQPCHLKKSSASNNHHASTLQPSILSNNQTTPKMSQISPRERLSLYTHRTLSHDVAAALKASTPLTIRTTNIEPTPAPPPSPVDFGSYASDCSTSSQAGEWMIRRNPEQVTA
jgi:hypothetical protein